MEKKLNIALVGLGFGGCFAEIYKRHPHVGERSLSDTTSREGIKRIAAAQKRSGKNYMMMETTL